MNQNTYKLLIATIRAAFGFPVKAVEINASDIPDLEILSVNHKITPIVILGLKRLGYNSLISQDIVLKEAKSVFDYTQQNLGLTEISNVLESASIPYIPLKGAVLRKFYPQPWMRTSSDIDILVKGKDIERAIRVINENSSFKYYKKLRHDAHFVNQNVHLELHYNFNYGVEQIDVALNNPWKYAVKRFESCRYDFSSDFLLFYIISHAAKHLIQNGGIGIRNFLDIYLLLNKTSIDESNVISLCESSGLLGFYKACRKLINVWFYDDDHDDFSKSFEDIVLSGGVFGSNHLKVLSTKRHDKCTNYTLARIFKSRVELEKIYPKLKKYSILFPWYQIKRWLYLISTRKNKEYISELNHAKTVTQEEVKKYDEIMHTMGL